MNLQECDDRSFPLSRMMNMMNHERWLKDNEIFGIQRRPLCKHDPNVGLQMHQATQGCYCRSLNLLRSFAHEETPHADRLSVERVWKEVQGQGIKDALAKDKMATSRHPWLQPHKKPLRWWIENITQELVICQTVRPPGIQSRAEGYLSLMWGAYSLKKPHAILTPNTTGFSVKLDLQQSLEASLRKTEVGLSAATSLTPNNPVLESLLLLSHDVHPPLILCSHLFLPGLKVSLLLHVRKVWTYALSFTAIEVELGVWKGYWLMQCHNPSTRM